MNKSLAFFHAVCAVILLASCANSYHIDGSSDISGLDSRKMYLKALQETEFQNIDSTEVVHGKFDFIGSTDSVRMAYIVVSEGYSLPLVIGDGDVVVRINKARTEWGGTPLNDKLYKFVKSLDSLNLQLQDLEHEYNIAFMDGEDMNEVIPRLSRANQMINVRIDSLVTRSITDNFDNILGSGIFMLATQAQRYPEMSPWVVEIMSKATENFKNNAYVRQYLQQANYIQNVQNGLEAPPNAAPQPTTGNAAPQAPTPNELAAPATEESDTTSTGK
jgi:hypothetical protein